MDHETRFDRMYTAFNARDADAVLEFMGDHVEWPKAFEGGYVQGKDAVREYWQRQWTEISPTVIPLSNSTQPDGTVDVEVDQEVRSMEGALIDHRTVHHVYTFDGESIVRMDVVVA